MTCGWHDANNEYLAAALHWLRLALRRHARLAEDTPPSDGPADGEPHPSGQDGTGHPAAGRAGLVVTADQVADARDAWTTAAGAEPPPALVELSQRLGLWPFEQKILLLCVAMELDPAAGSLCALAQRDDRRPWPTFALALQLFDDPSWEALSAQRPLRYWRLVDVTQPPGQPLTASPLHADERIVNYVKGLNYLDDRLEGLVTAVPRAAGQLPASQRAAAAEVAGGWARAAELGSAPVVHLLGPDRASKLSVGAAAAALLGRYLYRIPVSLLPLQSPELETLARLWARESLLLPLALYLDGDSTDVADIGAESGPVQATARFLTMNSGVFALATREAWPDTAGAAAAVDVARPAPDEQRAAWLEVLGPEAKSASGRLTSQFNFDLETIRAIARTARPPGEDTGADGQGQQLWDACVATSRPRLDALAQRIDCRATWDDLVLPGAELGLLQQIAAQVRNRSTVYHDWGFAERTNRGLGITALFAGPSGTGKTMAAEVLANDLRLSLYRIDLSAVVSKYIGETEKNLRRLFDAAEQGAAVLLFDEADALFGKRSEVKDSHDRYANIEVNYLLQRMESYRGVAVLATNMRSALDQAFLRRLRFVVTFPFPAAAQRREIWSKVFPPRARTDDLDLERLAGLTASGGMIHNIALNAAFLAAGASAPVSMSLVLDAARTEFRKLELTVAEDEFIWRPKAGTPA
jgi:ATPase family associated with various cellular activities (AAA)